MRPKFILVIMLLAIGAFGLLVVLKRNQGEQGGAKDSAAPADSTNVEATARPERAVASVANGPGSRVEPLGSSVSEGQANPSGTNNLISQPGPVLTSIVATTPEQDHRAAIEKDMDKLNEALLDGGSDPGLVQAVRDRLLNPDADVRKAAVETIMNLDDRAAIPNLNAALAQVQDPREKVAIMDAIEYLQTPEGDPQFIAEAPPSLPAATGATNPYVRPLRAAKH